MSEIIICPTGLTGRIRGMKVREERILSDRKPAKSLSQNPRPSEARAFGPRSRREIEGVAVATSRSRNAEIGPKARASRPRGFWDRL